MSSEKRKIHIDLYLPNAMIPSGTRKFLESVFGIWRSCRLDNDEYLMVIKGVGCVEYKIPKHWGGNRARITGIAVREKFRRKGFATRLMKACLKHLVSLGINECESSIYPYNAPSIALHKSVGYRFICTKQTLSGGIETRWEWIKGAPKQKKGMLLNNVLVSEICTVYPMPIEEYKEEFFEIIYQHPLLEDTVVTAQTREEAEEAFEKLVNSATGGRTRKGKSVTLSVIRRFGDRVLRVFIKRWTPPKKQRSNKCSLTATNT